MRKIILTGILIAASGPITANATIICAMCEVIDGAAGTYIGSYDPSGINNGTFNHTDIQADVGQNTPFNDFLLFDLSSNGGGRLSASFDQSEAITDFEGALWTDGGSTCAMGMPGTCSAVIPGAKLFQVSATDGMWEIVFRDLMAGRYIIQITGSTRSSGPSSYSGKLSTGAVAVPTPSTLALLAVGLLGFAYRRRKH